MGSTLTTSFVSQVRACVVRQYQIIWGDKATFIIKQGATLVQALVAGSLFYMAPANSSGLFLKGGALFFSLLYNTLLAMSEVTDSFTGRPVLAKHKGSALYHTAAWNLAQIAADLPVLIFQVSMFSIVLYFMVGLQLSAGAFFTYWIVVFSTTMCMTALFRAIGAAFSNFDAASKVSGFGVAAILTYTGYMIPKTSMHPWFVWIYWINPLAYAFQSLMDNEFHGQVIPCVNNNLIPNGPTYTNTAHQACSGIGGAPTGATSVTGDQYLSSLAYSNSHLWRNLGILWVWWTFYVCITIFATSRWKVSSGHSGYLLIPREKVKHNKFLLKTDEESQTTEKSVETPSTSESPSEIAVEESLIRNSSVFTWKNLTYTVKTPSGDRVLLDNVQGWVKPGMLGALMGSSGAGKTTLLDVLAQRKTDGTIRGSIMVDGRPLSVSFQRSAGYCEQMDVHEPLATVREALEFSALLRQSRDVPRNEKLRYVDTIINLLEMRDIEHTLIGKTGAGLSVEQRKRLTIGVELVSKPSILIFLDEPTSGLDGQAAFNTVLFLKKLAAVGQAVLVTIHQPSASLFAQFDTLLLLAKGGKTVYFGNIGDQAATIKEYFGRYGAPCPPSANPAEHMIDVVSGPLSQGKDWNQVWLASPEHEKVVQELDYIISDAAAKEPGTTDDGHEFATPLWEQMKLVSQRNNVSLYRNTDYINNKFMLHIGSALFNGFTFWMIGDTVGDLQLRLFSIFNFIFVAPGVINQLQPLFIDRRDIYETRERKSKMYSWWSFTTALIVSEIPYLCICAVLYFACWYYTAGFPTDSNKAGASFFVMLMYEFVYTGIGQFVAAYAPNAVFASLVNPLIIGVLVSFCGVLVPYAEIQAFWRYWIYYLNPFNYLMGSLLTFTVFDAEVNCTDREFAIFDPPSGQTCASYLADFLAGRGSRTNLVNPEATSACRVCEYRRGSDYLYGLNLKDYYYGWRDAAIVVIFALSSYGMVYLLMKLRTKASKKAE
jgi:ATP-binding cassette subfamily G (WHITE) protein 2 (SNQ2)